MKINDGFQYKKLAYAKEYLDIEFGKNNEGYVDVRIPHDANIADFSEFYQDFVIWYRRPLDEIKERNGRYLLYFEGVYMDASIYINDTFVGKWVNGYTSFWFDITEALSEGENTLYVSIDYRNPNSRWYAGPGINRDVYLYHKKDNYILPDSVYAAACLNSGGKWNLTLEAGIAQVSENVDVRFDIPELGVSILAKKGYPDAYKAVVSVENPRIWDIDTPYLYTLKTVLLSGSEIVDETSVDFGFRSIMADTDKGFFLNGRRVKLKGVCLHSDGGCLGSAFSKDMAYRQILSMKRMGVNAIRLAHNVFAPDFLRLCDENGMLVFNEIFDCWKIPKTEFDYARFFDEWYDKDIKSWVCRDRNHPCVIFWSAGNEIYDTHVSKEGRVTLNLIADEIRKYDYCEHAMVTLASNYMAWDNTQLAVDDIKIVGYNYGENLYKDHHAKHPHWYILGSETASCVQSRGIYHFPLSVSLLADKDEQCSSLGNSTTSWGAPNLDFCIATERDCEFSMGQFLWAGIDYLGEPTPYHTKNSYFGIMDTAVLPKDAYYLFQSCWVSAKENPVVHILPYWDFNEGQLIDVRICSNLPEVELFVNGESFGRKVIDHEKSNSFFADYRIPYVKGELRAASYEEGSSESVACESVYTPGEVSKIRVSMLLDGRVEKEITGNPAELSFDSLMDKDKLFFLEITALDDQNHEVPNANCRVLIECEGECSLEGTDNGNSTDYESFKSSSKRLFSGKMLAVIRGTENSGEGCIRISIDENDVSVRRLGLLAKNGQSLALIENRLTPENPIIEISVEVCPEKAKYKEIRYQICNEKGVPVNNALIDEVSEDGKSIRVRAVGDSEFILRADAVGFDDRIAASSTYEFVAEGFGKMNLNPYEFVYGPLHTRNFGEIGVGNENGISTSRTEDCWVLYENLDFGKNGSDSVTIPIFELDNTPTSLTFWKGEPHAEGSYVLGEGIYDKKSIWNVYQEQTFKLDEVLRGIADFGIELHKHKIHLKGFYFEERNRTFGRIKALDADEIYGDSFERCKTAVMNIGNNVSLVFKDLDFGNDGIVGIGILGHTPLENNTIHLLFSGNGNQERRILEFKGSEGFAETVYHFDKLNGKWDLTFLFLPGSNFDFESFRLIYRDNPMESH